MTNNNRDIYFSLQRMLDKLLLTAKTKYAFLIKLKLIKRSLNILWYFNQDQFVQLCDRKLSFIS